MAYDGQQRQEQRGKLNVLFNKTFSKQRTDPTQSRGMNMIPGGQPPVPRQIQTRLSIMIIFYGSRRPFAEVSANLGGILMGLGFVGMGGSDSRSIPLLLTAPDRAFSVSVLNEFVELRSSLADREAVRKEFITKVGEALLDSRMIRPTGITLRFIDILSVDSGWDAQTLFQQMGLPVAEKLGLERETFEAVSFKFYVHESKALHELDLGPSIVDRAKVYVELESRYDGFVGPDEWNQAWAQSQTFLLERERALLAKLTGEFST